MQGSKMFVPLGGQIPLEELIRGISIQSGNDACVVVAEGVAGSEEAFANLMNDKAKQLGMSGSHFVDASGWPSPDHYTTAHDLGVLARAIIHDFPEYYPYLSEREFTYHGIRQFNRNLLLGNTALGVDGLKTGHTEAAGYGIMLSAKQAGRRLVLVINGLDSEADRAAEGERLLNWGFRNFDNRPVARVGQPITKATVWMGKELSVPLTVAENIVVSVPKIGGNGIKLKAEYQAPIQAPVKKGQEVGVLKVTLPSGEVRETKLVAAQDVEKLGFFGQIPRKLGL
jgi:D-alanyl-D-alanine carboxypeptidase (penicillin-binding protein 5/6)